MSDTNSSVSKLLVLVMDGGTERPQYLHTKNTGVTQAFINARKSVRNACNSPSDLVPSLHRTVVIHLNIIKITVVMVLKVERVKGQPH